MSKARRVSKVQPVLERRASKVAPVSKAALVCRGELEFKVQPVRE